jgi:hypothetical protein
VARAQFPAPTGAVTAGRRHHPRRPQVRRQAGPAHPPPRPGLPGRRTRRRPHRGHERGGPVRHSRRYGTAGTPPPCSVSWRSCSGWPG